MLLLVGLLVVFEVAMGFNNAIINASILAKLNHYWQRMFLTVGLFIAVVVMRLFFPIAIVVATVGTSFHSVIDAALYHPTVYAAELTRAHPVIAAFGSAFLLMLFLDFLIDEGKRVHWI
ncbi:MAG TPA: DUF475 domain-containing protein, partial [Candidatus Saccharimonadia bacterium]|nr:DUF475 domain-containing protein [Candidatus Saccharimonadia bacterium]